MTLPFITAPALAHPGLTHAFFTRQGGVSTGIYASLNGGVGSRDEPAAVAENRRRMSEILGVPAERLVVPYQVHSADALIVDAPLDHDAFRSNRPESMNVIDSNEIEHDVVRKPVPTFRHHALGAESRPRCDGVVTATPGLALGVTGADCGVVLFADAEAGIIGAAHAGWKGAFGGVLEATLVAMEHLGARRTAVAAVLGPTIGQASYEVGPEFRARFLDEHAAHARFFRPSARADHHLFDLPAFIGRRLEQAGIGGFTDLGLDTYADEARFFSYRRATHRSEPDYGRLVAAIALR